MTSQLWEIVQCCHFEKECKESDILSERAKYSFLTLTEDIFPEIGRIFAKL